MINSFAPLSNLPGSIPSAFSARSIIEQRELKSSGLKTQTLTLDIKALFTLNPGFSVVAPIKTIKPDSM